MRKKRKSTFGLRLDQLANLFGLAAEERTKTEPENADERLAQILRHQLTSVLPGNTLLFTNSTKAPDDKQYDLTPLVGRSLLQVFFNPQTSIGQLQVIKQASKHLSTTSVSEAEHAVATTIYHAAIASCLVHHAKKSTKHSYEKLVESFTLLIEKKWMSFELVELFSRARDICKQKLSKK